MDNKLLLRIDSLLEHIDKVLKDTENLSIKEIKQNDLLLRATCFSISQIGEIMNQLAEKLCSKYSNLPWVAARSMRNVIVHDYGSTDIEQVYSTIHQDLPSLRKSLVAIKNDIESNALTTDRLILRKIKIEDAESIFLNWTSDPEVTKYLTWLPHENIETTKLIVKKRLEEEDNPKTIRYVITTKESDEPIGMIDVVSYIDGAPEIGYSLSRKHRNKGYMTEACKAFIKYLFDIGFTKIVIEADERNASSNRVIEKCAFKFTYKENKEHCSELKPEPITVNWYEIIK